jgi:hypothetical protein
MGMHPEIQADRSDRNGFVVKGAHIERYSSEGWRAVLCKQDKK